MADGLLLRNTALNQYASCPKKFYWSSRRNLQPKARAPYLIDGGLTHEGLKTYHHPLNKDLTTGDRLEASLAQIEKKAGQDDSSMARRLLQAYADRYPTDDFQVLSVEQQVSFPLTKDITFRGTADMIIRQSDGSLALGEHKTAAQLSAKIVTRYARSPQTLGYVYALQQTLKEPIASIMFNFLVKTKTARCERYSVAVVQAFEEQWYAWAVSFGQRLQRDIDEDHWQENRYECFPIIGGECPYMPLCWYGENDRTLAFFEEGEMQEPTEDLA